MFRGKRKEFLIVVVAAAALSLLSGELQWAASAGPQEIVVNRKAEGVSLDPAKTTTMEDYAVIQNIYSSLFRFKPDSFDLIPDLATDYQVSTDGKTYTFKLRQGVQWHKGFGEFTVMRHQCHSKINQQAHRRVKIISAIESKRTPKPNPPMRRFSQISSR